MDQQILAGRESLERWNGFLSTFENVVLIVLTTGIDHELEAPLARLRGALDRTFKILDNALAADPRRALVREEYFLVKSIYALLDGYTLENRRALNTLFEDLKSKMVMVSRL